MFAYCVELLHLSEPETETNLRMVVARATRRHPILLQMLGDGRLHLSGIALLAPHPTETNRDEVLARATHSSKRRIEELVAGLAPRPDVPTTIRKLPDRARPTPTGSAPEQIVSSDGRNDLGMGHRRDGRTSHPERRGTPQTAWRRIGTACYPDAARASSSRSPRNGSGFSSRQAVPSGRSSSGWRRCCVRRCRTATWQR